MSQAVATVLLVREPSAKYLVQPQPERTLPLVQHFHLLSTAPGGVARLRELILTLAVQGKLVPQDPSDEPASELLKKIRAEKDRLLAEGKIKRDKPLAEITEEEMPFELPLGWEWQALADVGTWAIGSGFPHEVQGREGLPILFAKVSDMNLPGNEQVIARTNHTIDDETVERLRINVHQAGTVIFPKIGGAIATNKRRVLVRPTAIDNNCLGLTPSVAISTYYLFLLLSSIDFTAYQAGTSVPALSQGTLGKIPVGLPPLAEQSRIVTRVEELMRLCDALEAKGKLEAGQHTRLVSTLLGTLTQSESPEALAENWQRVASHFDLLLDRPEAVDALEQTILQLAVRGLLVPQDPNDEPASELLKKIRFEKGQLILQGKIKRDKPLPPITEEERPFELPQGWEWVRLGEIADNRLGKMLDKAKNTGKRYPYLRNTNVQWHHIDLDDIKEIYLEASELDEFRLIPGDLLICEGGYPGRCAIWSEPDREMYFQKALHRVRPRGEIAVELIAISLEADSKSGNLEQHFTGATIKHFVGQALDRYVVPLPPLAEQSRIVTRVNELRRLCADLRQRLSAQQKLQTQLAEALVAEVV